MLPFRVRMDKAIIEYSKHMKIDESELRRILKIDEQKQKMTVLAFQKKYGKFLNEEGKKLSSEMVIFYAVKMLRLGEKIIFIGILLLVIGFILLYLITI